MSWRKGHNPIPSTGTTGIRSLYDQRPIAKNLHSKAVAKTPPSSETAK